VRCSSDRREQHVKVTRIIDATAVPQVFDEERIAKLARIAKLPSGSDLGRFGESVRSAVRNYVEKAAQQTPNSLAREIRNLHRLASTKNFGGLASAVEAMTPEAWTLLNERSSTIEDHYRSRAADLVARGRLTPNELVLVENWWVEGHMYGWRIPSRADLRDPTKRGQAADALLALLEVGGERRRGRKRSKGRRSVAWHPYLIGPSPSRAEPRREAERQFVMFLQFDMARMGVNIPVTTDPRKRGPFANLVSECLVLMKATGSATAPGLAVQVINDLQKERVAEIRDQDADRPCQV
jgi:hypothetical protein